MATDPRFTRAQLDELRADLNPGIVEVVMWLRHLGFDTVDSGDGKTHACECDRPYPYVSIRVDVTTSDLIAESILISKLLAERGIELSTQWVAADDDPDPEMLPVGVHVNASFSPVDFVGIIDIAGLDDARFRAAGPPRSRPLESSVARRAAEREIGNADLDDGT